VDELNAAKKEQENKKTDDEKSKKRDVQKPTDTRISDKNKGLIGPRFAPSLNEDNDSSNDEIPVSPNASQSATDRMRKLSKRLTQKADTENVKNVKDPPPAPQQSGMLASPKSKKGILNPNKFLILLHT